MFATTQDQLDYLRFPLGHMHKSEVREHARRFGLDIAEKPDSQDICFVPNGKYVSVIEKLRPGSLEAGKIEDVYGNVLGEHTGIINYTIGQRKGLGIGGGEALYVIRLDPVHHRVIVGPKEYLRCSYVTLKEWNFLKSPEALAALSELKVKYRSSQEPVKARLSWQENRTPTIHFLEEEYGVSPGQACVIYDGDDQRVLGGGWIAEAVSAHS